MEKSGVVGTIRVRICYSRTSPIEFRSIDSYSQFTPRDDPVFLSVKWG